ncbi:ABC transporter permease [Catenulispora sp. NL8]|uniref:ABC transporter permease n=1 Tax=Catenulispora pinistramenti TaxID=2705254 RepID=A0ABS5L5I4_9ACTN|nr:ABC transporter permease [Catenulispora pinistramenti]MBS2553582.1 ABC transporter permease [Catenulispora pinistramenti]
MNFVKRAGLSLVVRASRTVALLAIFAVICTLLLGGFLLRSAAARQEAAAQTDIGVDVTVGKPAGFTPELADRLGASNVVHRYNPEVAIQAGARDLTPLVSPMPKPGAGASTGAGAGNQSPDSGPDLGPLEVNGVRDSGLLLPFSYGSTKVLQGRGILPEDAGHDVAMVEDRLAAKNRLTVGSVVQARSTDGKHTVPVTVVGVFQDPTPDPPMWTPPHELPGNAVYVPLATARALSTGPLAVTEAVYRVGSPDQADQLTAAADRLLGTGTFSVAVNDKAYRDQVRPIQRVGAFAALIVWVIAGAGALVLGLIVVLQIRERRTELGVLLSMGEKKWKLIGQHVLEMTAVALPAVALATLIGALAGPSAGHALLGPHPAVSASAIRLEPAAVAEVAAIGLGICLVSTVLPGIGILRLHPRSILTDTE